MEADFADIENQATDVNKFFLDRINIRTMADSDEAAGGTRLLVEEFISHTMEVAGRRYAARGYRETEQLAERLKVKIDLTDSIFAMKKYETGTYAIPLKMLFSKEGAFFNSVIGEKLTFRFKGWLETDLTS